MPTLDEILRDPSCAANLPPGEITRLLRECGAAVVILSAAQPAPVVDTIPPITPEPEAGLITVPEAAARLHRSSKWVYRRSKTLPFITRLGRSVLVDPHKLAKWVEKQGKRPNPA